MMNRKCEKCGAEYTVGHFSFDPGLCRECRPGLLAMPLWLRQTPAGTWALWRAAIAAHVALLTLLCLLLDGGGVSLPGVAYCLTVILYFAIRLIIARSKGYPVLSRLQAVAILLLPVYGLALAVFLFHWGQWLRWGD